MMRIGVGGDHAGFPLKDTVVNALKSMGHEVIDYGSYDPDPSISRTLLDRCVQESYRAK